MPIDPSIPLQAGNQLPKFGPDWGVIQNALKTQIAMQNQAQVQQAENALKAAYSDPNNFDPNTLSLKPNAMVNLAQQAPQAAMEVRNNLLKNQEQQARAGVGQAKILEQYGEQANDIANKARRAYEDALENRVLPAQAQAIGQRVYTEELNRWLPNLPPEIASRVPKDFDVMRARATEQGWKEHQAQLTGARAARKEDRDERKEDRAERREERMSAAQEKELAVKGYVKTEDKDPLKPGTIRTIWVNPDRSKPPLDLAGYPTTISGEPPTKASEQKPFKVSRADGKLLDVYRTPDGKVRTYIGDHEVPEETLKSGSIRGEGQTAPPDEEAARQEAEAIFRLDKAPPSGYASSGRGGMAPLIRKALTEIEEREGRKYDAKDWLAAQRLNTLYADTRTGTAGGIMNATNTAVNHLDYILELKDAIKNRDIPAINRVLNFMSTQAGRPDANNFKAAAQFVAGETIRAVSGAAGALEDRKKLEERLADYAAPGQTEGAVDTLSNLLAGRLAPMRRQWTTNHLDPDKWDAKLDPPARDRLGPLLDKMEKRSEAKGGARPANEAAIPPKPAAGEGAIPTVKTKAERDALPPGAKYYKEGDDLNAPPRTRE